MTRCSVLLLCAFPLLAQIPNTIQTVAGNGSSAYSGDNVPATGTALGQPVDVTADRAGNLYIADQLNHRIRKVTPDGNITTVAGNGILGYSGDGGQATSAQLNTPTGIAISPDGTLYICDTGNQRIRRVSAAGIISTLAGNGAKGFSGDGGDKVNASFYNPVRVAVEPSGNLIVADQSNHRLRRVLAVPSISTSPGSIFTIAGNGAGTPATGAFSGDGGPATAASLNNPTAVAVDSAGTIYFSDQFNHRIRRVAADGTISTVAGNGNAAFGGDGGSALSASLNYPGGLTLDTSGNIYFNDDINYRTRMVTAAGMISTIAGNGSVGFSGDGGTALQASFNGNFGIALDLSGNLYIADSTNNRIRKITYAVNGLAPVVTAAGVTNAASFQTGASPGAIATIFGQRLTRNLTGILQNSSVPLPTSLAGTTVTIGGKTAPLFNVINQNGQEQLSVQIPVDTVPGPAVGVLINNGTSTAAFTIAVTPAQPGIFTLDGTQAAALHANFQVVNAAQPAAPGETVIVFATGLGTVTPTVATGAAASNTSFSNTTATFTATVAGQNAPLLFSGLAPGFVALGQINLTVPANAPSGAQDLILTTGSTSSNTVKLQIR